MDIELETYVDEVMDQQVLRSGIFGNTLDRWMAAIAFYRSGVDARGAVHARRRTI